MAHDHAQPLAQPREPADDLVLPFRAVRSGVSGRLVRLGPVVDTILTAHDYPDPVSEVLGQALTLAAMLGASLKFQSKLTLQTQGDGPIGFLVVNYSAPGNIRGYASFDAERAEQAAHAARAEASGGAGAVELLGHGHLAMTIDPGGTMDRYQGVVPLEGTGLISAAHTYFRQSEQLPTFIRLAVARHYVAGPGDAPGAWHWRAGGLIIQHLSPEGGRRAPRGADPGAQAEASGGGAQAGGGAPGDPADHLLGERDENWERTRILAATVEDHELLDPLLAPERLLYRLFHEEGVRAFEARPIQARCTCTRERVARLLTGFSKAERADMMAEDGRVAVTCEFCNTRYSFAIDELTASRPRAGRKPDARS